MENIQMTSEGIYKNLCRVKPYYAIDKKKKLTIARKYDIIRYCCKN